MKVLIVGATGTIGKALTETLSQDHEIIPVSFRTTEQKVDMTSSASIIEMFEQVGAFDALVCAAGSGYWGHFATMQEDDFYKGIRNKLMGQVNLVLIGQRYINPNGSFTLTSGILGKEPVKHGANLSVVNAAIDAFVMAAAIELEKGVRINGVSPGVVQESAEKFGSLFPGHVPVAMSKVVAAYRKSLEGAQTGQVFNVHT